MKVLYSFLFFLVLSGCQTIDKKSQETIKQENKKLSKFLQQPESELKIAMGNPDEITYNDTGSKFFTYIKKKCTSKNHFFFKITKKLNSQINKSIL